MMTEKAKNRAIQAQKRLSRNAQLNSEDLLRIETALRLRVEACKDNDDKSGAKRWSKTRDKVLCLLGLTQIEERFK